LVVLALYSLSDTISRLALSLRPSVDRTVLVALLTAVAASALNPYGVGLWAYIPSLFFAKFNYLIDELHAVDFRRPEFVPFLIFLGIWLFTFWRAVARSKVAAATPINGGDGGGEGDRGNLLEGVTSINAKSLLQLMQSLAVFGLSCFEAWTHLRLIPFAVLILTSELTLLLSLNAKSVQSGEGGGLLGYFDSKLDEGLAPVLKLGSVGCAVFILFVATAGTLLTCMKIQSPVLPQSGGAFRAPFKAIDALVASHTALRGPDAGNILNDAQYGDMLIWYHPDSQKVFIDTRYDMYGEALVRDYLRLTKTEPGWQELMNTYKIKTIFLRVSEPLVTKLRADPAWHTLFLDERTAVLTRL
jgi:hypothetical protein